MKKRILWCSHHVASFHLTTLAGGGAKKEKEKLLFSPSNLIDSPRSFKS